MKPFKNTFLAILIKDLQSVSNLLGNVCVFFGILTHLKIISFNIDVSVESLELAIIGTFMWGISFAIECVYHYLRKGHEE